MKEFLHGIIRLKINLGILQSNSVVRMTMYRNFGRSLSSYTSSFYLGGSFRAENAKNETPHKEMIEWMLVGACVVVE